MLRREWAPSVATPSPLRTRRTRSSERGRRAKRERQGKELCSSETGRRAATAVVREGNSCRPRRRLRSQRSSVALSTQRDGLPSAPSHCHARARNLPTPTAPRSNSITVKAVEQFEAPASGLRRYRKTLRLSYKRGCPLQRNPRIAVSKNAAAVQRHLVPAPRCSPCLCAPPLAAGLSEQPPAGSLRSSPRSTLLPDRASIHSTPHRTLPPDLSSPPAVHHGDQCECSGGAPGGNSGPKAASVPL